jgi:hypothetical protein
MQSHRSKVIESIAWSKEKHSGVDSPNWRWLEQAFRIDSRPIWCTPQATGRENPVGPKSNIIVGAKALYRCVSLVQEIAMRHLPTAVLAGTALLLSSVSAQEIADTIYRGGPILTIVDAQPAAEAVAVKDGRILAVGADSDVSRHQGPETQTFDLAGRTRYGIGINVSSSR